MNFHGMDDALRPNEEAFKAYYERGHKTWFGLWVKAIQDSRLPPSCLQIETLFPQHPYLPNELDVDDNGSLIATSTWIPAQGDCDLPWFEQTFHMTTAVATPTRISMTDDPKIGMPKWFHKDGGSQHLTVLTLAWAYVFSARWAEIIPRASAMEYTESEAGWRIDELQSRNSVGAEPAPVGVELGAVNDHSARWWAAVLAPGRGWHTSITGNGSRRLSPWSVELSSQDNIALSCASWQPQARYAEEPHVLACMFFHRSPHLATLWLGGIITGAHNMFLHNPRGLLGFSNMDLHEAAWTGTLVSFIQEPVETPPPDANFIRRADECRLMFLSQRQFTDFPPAHPYRPLGMTAIRDADVDVKCHVHCPGKHGLRFSHVAWSCLRGRQVVQEVAELSVITRRPVAQSSFPRPAGATAEIDYGWLDRNDDDMSPHATQSIFLWMREKAGFPVPERNIYRHEWIGALDFDDDGDPADAQLEKLSNLVGSINLDASVESWVLDTMSYALDSAWILDMEMRDGDF